MLDYMHFTRHIPVPMVFWDYRGFGASSGIPHERFNGWDLHDVICAFKNPISNVVLIGHSLGTNVTLAYLSHALDHKLYVPNKVILIHPFFRLADILLHKLNWNVMKWLAWLVGDMDQTSTIHRYLESNKGNRLFILYAPSDRVTPASPVVRALQNLKGVSLYNIGGEHHSIFYNDALFTALAQILKI
jgi:pimeloyl-ACP methyl ester carboxylesterase